MAVSDLKEISSVIDKTETKTVFRMLDKLVVCTLSKSDRERQQQFGWEWGKDFPKNEKGATTQGIGKENNIYKCSMTHYLSHYRVWEDSGRGWDWEHREELSSTITHLNWVVGNIC